MSLPIRRFNAAAGALLWGAFLVSGPSCATSGVACKTQPATSERGSATGLAAYAQLQRQAPHLFAQMGDAGRGEIEILLNPRDIQAVEDRMERIYRKTWGPDIALEGSRAGVVMQDPYVLVIRDAVRFPSGKTGLYYRKISRTVLDGGSPGAFCLPLNAAGRVVMIKEYRHQQRGWRLSIPGGFRDPGETSEQAARREAMEETGITLGAVEALGDIEAEGEAVPLFVGQESTRLKILKPDEGEALGAVVELTPHELKQAVVAGGFRDRDGTWLAVQGALGSAVLKLEHWLAQQPHEEILQTTYATP